VVAVAEGFEMVGVAHSGEEAVQLAALTRPDLVLLDVNMPGIGGVDAARRIRRAQPSTFIVMMSADSGGRRVTELLGSAETAMLDKRRLAPRTLADIWARRRAR
jgi:two-component system, NarL family, invasion response regulator UvrY